MKKRKCKHFWINDNTTIHPRRWCAVAGCLEFQERCAIKFSKWKTRRLTARQAKEGEK